MKRQPKRSAHPQTAQEAHFLFVPVVPSPEPGWEEINMKAEQVAAHILRTAHSEHYGCIVAYGNFMAHSVNAPSSTYLAFTNQLDALDLTGVDYLQFRVDLGSNGAAHQHFENAIAKCLYQMVTIS